MAQMRRKNAMQRARNISVRGDFCPNLPVIGAHFSVCTVPEKLSNRLCLRLAPRLPKSRNMIRRLAALLALLWFGSIESAHAQQRAYPSLSRRPVESRDRESEVVQAQAQLVTAKPLDAAVVSELARLRAQASAGGVVFDRELSASDRAVAAATSAPVASEAWVTAQEALSVLDAGRFDSVTALAGMDVLYVEQLNAGGDAAALQAYRAPVLSMVDGQNDRLDSLRGRLARP